MKSILVAAIFMLVLQVCAEATELRGRIDGLIPSSGQTIPLSGVRVTLSSPGARDVTAVTGPDGFYFFHNIAPGQYVIEVNGNRYDVFVNPNGFQDVPPFRVSR